MENIHLRKILSEAFKQLYLFVISVLIVETISSDLQYIW